MKKMSGPMEYWMFFTNNESTAGGGFELAAAATKLSQIMSMSAR
jgi:hypothetical protein